MLSVRVAAAVARALPRRAGLVSTRGRPGRRLGGAAACRAAPSRSSFCREGEGLWRAPPSCSGGCWGWAERGAGEPRDRAPPAEPC